MSQKRSFDRDADHPLFRALVLMGGSLALSCGGSVVVDRNSSGGSNSTTNGGSTSAGTVGSGGGGVALAGSSSISAGGSFSASGATSTFGGSFSTGGEIGAGDSGITAAPTMSPSGCPWAQLDCSSLGAQCGYYLSTTEPTAGCACDPKRPKTAADCAPNEDIACVSAEPNSPYPVQTTNWDDALHIQCSCVPGPAVPDSDSCNAACQKLFPPAPGANSAGCRQPPEVICDASGVCTTVSDEVLHQEGITCGCAIITLK